MIWQNGWIEDSVRDSHPSNCLKWFDIPFRFIVHPTTKSPATNMTRGTSASHMLQLPKKRCRNDHPKENSPKWRKNTQKRYTTTTTRVPIKKKKCSENSDGEQLPTAWGQPRRGFPSRGIDSPSPWPMLKMGAQSPPLFTEHPGGAPSLGKVPERVSLQGDLVDFCGFIWNYMEKHGRLLFRMLILVDLCRGFLK